MITEALSGTVLGGLLRLAPEALRWLDRRDERRHELKLQEIELKFARQLQVRGSDNAVPVFSAGALEALRESYIQEQAAVASKRYPLVAVFASLVRPSVTWALLLLYVGVRVYSLTTGISVYGPEDIELFSSVLAFWFLGRVWERSK